MIIQVTRVLSINMLPNVLMPAAAGLHTQTN